MTEMPLRGKTLLLPAATRESAGPSPRPSLAPAPTWPRWTPILPSRMSRPGSERAFVPGTGSACRRGEDPHRSRQGKTGGTGRKQKVTERPVEIPELSPGQKDWMVSVFGPHRRILQPKLYGIENLPADGSLLAANHTIYGVLDAPIMITEIWRVRRIAARGLGAHGHYALPVWREFLTAGGMVRGTCPATWAPRSPARWSGGCMCCSPGSCPRASWPRSRSSGGSRAAPTCGSTGPAAGSAPSWPTSSSSTTRPTVITAT